MNQQNPVTNGGFPAAPTASYRGLTKREHIAAQMLAAYIAADVRAETGEPIADLASAACQAADALLVALAKSEVSE